MCQIWTQTTTKHGPEWVLQDTEAPYIRGIVSMRHGRWLATLDPMVGHGITREHYSRTEAMAWTAFAVRRNGTCASVRLGIYPITR